MPDPIYVIPDIHGHKAALLRALSLIENDGGAGARVVFLGDLVDRGPDSRGVIDTLIDGLSRRRNWTVLRGNHDQLFLDFLTDARLGSPRIRSGNAWLSENLGGAATLASYGVTASEPAPHWQEAGQAVPRSHRAFLSGLPYHLETSEHIFVHAGIVPGVPLYRQWPDDLIWIREPFLSDTRDHGRLVVHGHTAIDFPRHYGNRVNLDGGAGWGRPLRPAVFEGRDCWLLTDDGREQLKP